MKKVILMLPALVLALGLASCKPSEFEELEGSRTITDQGGTEVAIQGKVERVVIYDMPLLAPTLVQFLGSSERIVGMPLGAISNNSVGKKVAPNVENIANTYSLSTEDIINLEPDLIFSSYLDTAKVAEFRTVGLTVVAMNAQSKGIDAIGTIADWIGIFEGIFGDNGRGDLINDYNKAQKDKIANKLKDVKDSEKQKVLYIPWFNGNAGSLWTSSNEYVAGYFAEQTKAINVAANANVDVALSVEEVINANPDIIYLGSYPPSIGVEAFYETDLAKTVLSEVNAVKNQSVYRIPGGAFNWFMPTSAEIGLSLVYQAKCQYSELLSDVDMTQEVKDYYSKFYNAELTSEDLSIIFK